MIEYLQQLDSQVLLGINGWHAPFWDYFMKAASGKLIWIPLYVAIFYTFIRCYGWKHAVTLGVAIGVVITLADQTCATIIRPYVERMRPSNADNPLSQLVHIVNDYRGGSYGFPSCHATNTFALMAFVAMVTRNRLITGILLAWAVLNCYSRMYLGVHYPGDILVGGIVGAGIAAMVYYVTAGIIARICKSSNSGIRNSLIEKQRQASLPVAVIFATTVVGLLVYSAILV